MNLTYNSYFTYQTLTTALENFQHSYPNLAKLYSIGKSYEGRDIWCIELTNQATPAEEKPGFYLDGNTHAGEVTGTMACLYTIDWLLTNYEKHEQATRILDTKTIYVLPRICPDGAELYLTTGYMLRSTTHKWTFPGHSDPSGLVPEDIDGNGAIRQMRIRDDVAGDWGISTEDSRLMIRRKPHEYGGEYYRLYSEGLIENYDGIVFEAAPPRWGIDMNRNYPINWKPPHTQHGAGDLPLSEPESKAVTDFMLSKRNLAGAVYHHTSGGLLLRPNAVAGDDKMNKADLAMYKILGAIGEEMTGYPCQDVFGVFAGNKEQWGTFIDLSYDYLGLNSFATELWDLSGRSGIKEKGFGALEKLTYKQREEMALKTLRWNDEEMNGECFHPWTEFDHPQLGKVEIGGWNLKEGIQNPPINLLEEECANIHEFTLMNIECLPQLVIRDVKCENIASNVWRVIAAVENAGFLPTAATQKAVANKITAPVKAELIGGKVLQSDAEMEVGHLNGRSSAIGFGGAYAASAAGQRKKVEWLVEADAGSEVCIKAHGERAGTVRYNVRLGRQDSA